MDVEEKSFKKTYHSIQPNFAQKIANFRRNAIPCNKISKK